MQVSKCTLEEFQTLIGRLQWVTYIIAAGRPFISRLIDRTIGVEKPHFFIRVTEELSG